MRAAKVVHAVDSHTEGMPTRVITGGIGPVPGSTMAERRVYFIEHLDHVRRWLMREPRGHSAMSGAILQPPCRDDADWGVLYIEVSGLLPMCGHGTIGAATVLVETGMVEVTEPETLIRLDTPAGLVTVRVAVSGGHATSVTLRNVPAFVHDTKATVAVEGVGSVTYDMAFGGNFYAIVPASDLGLDVDPAQSAALIEHGLAVMGAINDQAQPVHPEQPEIAGCKHVVFTAAGGGGADARNAVAIHPGWIDRSPCGTGTSARMAQLHHRGKLGLDQPFVNESLIGSRFTGRLVSETRVADRIAVIPEITGSAWITGMGQYLLDPTDPFPEGFSV